jgi:uncharacterized protein YoxC
MNNLFLGIITVAVIVAAIIFIYVMVELRKTIHALRELVNTMENSLKPTIVELQGTLKSVKHVANNVTTVSEDVKILSGSLREVGENVKRVSRDIGHVVDFVDGITSSATVEASGLKAGIKAGLWYLVKNLTKQG